MRKHSCFLNKGLVKTHLDSCCIEVLLSCILSLVYLVVNVFNNWILLFRIVENLYQPLSLSYLQTSSEIAP